MISITKKAIEVSSFLKAKFNLSSEALFSTALFMGLAVLALTPEMAMAEDGGNGVAGDVDADIVSTVICNIINELQGGVVRGVAAFAVIFLGFSLFLGKISWGTCLALGIGVACVFGAEQIISVMAGRDEACVQGVADGPAGQGDGNAEPAN